MMLAFILCRLSYAVCLKSFSSFRLEHLRVVFHRDLVVVDSELCACMFDRVRIEVVQL